jgi:hypothetical protein
MTTVISIKVNPQKKDEALISFKDFNPISVTTTTATCRKIESLEEYWNIFYENVPTFKEYIHGIFDESHKQLSDQELINIITNTTKDCVKYLIDTYNIEISSWCDSSKRTKTSFFVDEQEAEMIFEFVVSLIVSFPYFFNVKEIGDAITDKYRKAISTLWKLSVSRMKFDDYKQALIVFKCLLSEEATYLTNFIHVVFSLLTSCKISKVSNFFGYFVSVISESYQFTIKSFPETQVPPTTIRDLLMRRESHNKDLISVISTTLLVSKTISLVQSKCKVIKESIKTPLGIITGDIFRQVFSIDEAVLNRYTLEFQYLMYLLCKGSKKLKSLYPHAIDLFRVAAKTPEVVKKGRSSFLSLKSLLIKHDLPYIDILLRRLSKLSHLKNFEQLIYIDTGNSFEKNALYKGIVEMVDFYTKVVVDDDPEVVDELKKCLSKIDFRIRSSEDLLSLKLV